MKIKILMVCGAGLGSSFACQMSTEEVLKEHGIDASLDHSDISSALAQKSHVIVTGENFRRQFEAYDIPTETKMVYLKNIVSKEEITEKLIPVIKEIA